MSSIALKREIHGFVDSLGYDFSTFEINNFIQFIANRRRKEINVLPVRFESPELFGVWLPTAMVDYIYYRVNGTHYVHQVHTILHELGHVVLGHCALSVDMLLVDDVDMSTLLSEPCVSADKCRVLLRQVQKIYGDPQEEEAELFGQIIQGLILQNKRLKYLVKRSSSLDRTIPVTDSMGLNDD